MAYCTLEEIENIISTDKLAQLTDDAIGISPVLSVNSDYVNFRIEVRSDFIDSFICKHYDLPITNLSALNILKDICADLVVYDMYMRRGRAELTDDLKQLYSSSLKLLTSLQTGAMKLDRTGEATTTMPRFFSVAERTPLFSDTYLNKMP